MVKKDISGMFARPGRAPPALPFVLHADGAGGQRCDGQVMRHEDQGGAQLVVHAQEKLHDMGGILAIEVAGGLVGKQDGGAIGEAAGDGYVLLLSPPESSEGKVLQAMLQPNVLEEFQRSGRAFPSGQSSLEHGNLDVLNHREGGKKVKRLKNKPNFPGAVFGRMLQVRDGFSAIGQRARAGSVQ